MVASIAIVSAICAELNRFVDQLCVAAQNADTFGHEREG
jgi:hypothetical protein